MESCPQCHSFYTLSVHEEGGCLLSFLFFAGSGVFMVAELWVGSLLHWPVWDWLSNGFPSLTTTWHIALFYLIAMGACMLCIPKKIRLRVKNKTVTCSQCNYSYSYRR